MFSSCVNPRDDDGVVKILVGQRQVVRGAAKNSVRHIQSPFNAIFFLILMLTLNFSDPP